MAAGVSQDTTDLPRWVVVGGRRGGIIVRFGRSLGSDKFPERLEHGALVEELEYCPDIDRLRYRKIEGVGPEEGWVAVSLVGGNGSKVFLLRKQGEHEEEAGSRDDPAADANAGDAAPIPASPVIARTPVAATAGLPSRGMLQVDSAGVLRGQCEPCASSATPCRAWRCQDEGRTQVILAGGNAAAALSAAGAQLCECGCAADQHRSLTGWLAEVRHSLRRFRDPATTRRRLPSTAELPVEALEWKGTCDDVALHILSGGRFKPRSPDATCAPETDCQPFVSVCVPTTSKRHDFHGLLYANFKRQLYNNTSLELVVVDTGSKPSDFFSKKKDEDQRIVYRYYEVKDAQVDRTYSAITRQGMVQPNSYVPPSDSWSLGFKRNIAGALARGNVIVHFDDDDLYAQDYISFMVGKLRALVEANGSNLTDSPSLVKLREWHLFDFAGMRFHFIDPVTDPLTLDKWRKPMLYGYGFSYVYTKQAWLQQAFPDTEDCEDDIFINNLSRLPKAKVDFVRRRPQDADQAEAWVPEEKKGLVAHSFHADNTGVSEFIGDRRLGRPCGERVWPSGFAGLEMVLRHLAKQMPPPPNHPPLVRDEMPRRFKPDCTAYNNMFKYVVHGDGSRKEPLSRAVTSSGGFGKGRGKGHKLYDGQRNQILRSR